MDGLAGHAKDVVSHIQPMLPYIGRRGNGQPTVLRLSVNQP